MKGVLAGAIVLTQPIVTAFVDEDRAQPTTTDQPVRIGAPPMPRSGVSQADARQIAQTVRKRAQARCSGPASASTAPSSCSGATRGRTRCRRWSWRPSTTTWWPG